MNPYIPVQKAAEDIIEPVLNRCLELALANLATPQQEKEKGNTMYYLSQTDTNLRNKTYLHNRLDVERDVQTTNALKKFGLWNDTTPHTAKDLVERIQANKFSLRDVDAHEYDCFFDHFIWRDPTIIKDEAGYDAWEKNNRNTLTGLRDLIELDTPANALAAIKAYAVATIQ